MSAREQRSPAVGVGTMPTTNAVDTQERFLRAIAERIIPDQVVEVHLFPPIRQGPIESAVAIVAVADPPTADISGAAPDAAPDEPAMPSDASVSVTATPRHAIYTATYRHTRKGPDRGAWTVDVVAQADAPLDAVAAVVHGVEHRSDEEVATERLSGGEFRRRVGTGRDGTGRDGTGRDETGRDETARNELRG